MSGLEIAIPVISAVFALVSAFKDGGTILENIKHRRQNKGAELPNEKLQKVLQQGEKDLQCLYAEGIEEFGDAFERDGPLTKVLDALASRLKDVTLALQDSIIKQLTAASMDDSMTDFGAAINSAVQARREAIDLLNKRCMLLQRKQGQESSVQTQQATAQSSNLVRQSTKPVESLDRRETQLLTDVRREVPASREKRRTSSWKIAFRRLSIDDSQRRELSTPPLSNAASPEPRVQVTEHGLGANQPLSPQSMPRSSGVPSPQIDRTRTNSSVIGALSPSREIMLLSDSNNFGGLCKGAFRAQQMNLKKAMEASMKEYEWLYHCKKCEFKLMADPSHRGNPHFDDRIQKKGSVYFRFLFLWKSHVVTDDRARQYKCLLCILGGLESSMYKGEDRLMEHVECHEGGLIGHTQLLGPFEITSEGIVPASIGTFDLYFQPRRRISSTGFMLPESALAITPVRSQQQILQEDLYGNVWQSEHSHAVELPDQPVKTVTDKHFN